MPPSPGSPVKKTRSTAPTTTSALSISPAPATTLSISTAPTMPTTAPSTYTEHYILITGNILLVIGMVVRRLGLKARVSLLETDGE